MSSEQAMPVGESVETSAAPPFAEVAETIAGGADADAQTGQAIDHVLRSRLSEGLDAASESPDPAAGLDQAVRTVADELSRHAAPGHDWASAGAPDEGISGAIESLVRMALEMADPVAALEEGAETLAEALAARDLSEQVRRQTAEERWVDQQAAYQHARFHRVSELVDVGYSLDQAVAAANADEAEICARAAAVGSDPMEAIYRYAVLNGYRGRWAEPNTTSRVEQTPVEPDGESDDPVREVVDLVRLNDEDFAKATRGERWRMLMRA